MQEHKVNKNIYIRFSWRCEVHYNICIDWRRIFLVLLSLCKSTSETWSQLSNKGKSAIPFINFWSSSSSWGQTQLLISSGCLFLLSSHTCWVSAGHTNHLLSAAVSFTPFYHTSWLSARQTQPFTSAGSSVQGIAMTCAPTPRWSGITSSKPQSPHLITIYAPMIYTAQCIMFWMRVFTRGSGRRLGPGILEFFGPSEMASSR